MLMECVNYNWKILPRVMVTLLYQYYPCYRFNFFLIWRSRPSGLLPFRTILEIWILQTVGRTRWTGDQPVARPLPTRKWRNTERMQIYIHVSSGIRTLNLGVRECGFALCPRKQGLCNWLILTFHERSSWNLMVNRFLSSTLIAFFPAFLPLLHCLHLFL
jgi:hypothetical protein